jgi:multicomponent Na+:H+ antiporter subunit D
MLAPIAVIATGAIVLGIGPDYAVFLELAFRIVEDVFGGMPFEDLIDKPLEEALTEVSD